MSSRRQGESARPKLEAQPTVFFDILSENDATKRREIIGTLQKGSPTTGEVVNIMQSLAGDDYIEKSYLQMQKKLGEGGFAVVERALLSLPGRTPEVVAIKTLKPGLIKDEEDLHELIQEANVLRKLKHRYIVDFKGIGCMNTASVSQMRSSVFFGEEYMEGGSLKGMVVHQMRSKTAQVYRAEDAWRWCLQMAEALDYLHHCKPAVVHRDLKPENVLLTTRDAATSEARIADFGLHKRINRVRKARVESVRSMNAAPNNSPVKGGNGRDGILQTTIPGGEKEQDALQYVEGNSAIPGDDTKKKVRWQDQKEAFPEVDQSRTTVHDQEDTKVASSTQPGDGMGDEGSGVIEEGSSSGVDMELLVSSAAERSSSLNNVDPSDDAGNFMPNNGLNGADAELAAPGSQCESAPKRKGFFINAVDSLKVAHKQRQREPLKARQEDIQEDVQEGRQRGGSQAFENLDTEDLTEEKVVYNDVPDAYSSVMYSLGLSGSGHLSGMVGSLMYMAPEVVKGKQYTEKIDVFSFGLIMFEMFLGRLMIAQVLAGAFSPKQMEADLQKHAKKVSFGHRHAVPGEWPRDLRALICACWNQDPKMRPTMSEVITRLQDLKKNGVIKQMEQFFLDQLGTRASQWRCCTIS